MRTADLPGILAGFAVALVGFFLLGVSAIVSAPSLAERTSFVGGISVDTLSGDDVSPAQDVTENPYNLRTAIWLSPAEIWLEIAGWITVALIAGAAAARIGRSVQAWRGALSVGLAAACSMFWLAYDSPALSVWDVAAGASLVAFLVGATGGIGGLIAVRFA